MENRTLKFIVGDVGDLYGSPFYNQNEDFQKVEPALVFVGLFWTVENGQTPEISVCHATALTATEANEKFQQLLNDLPEDEQPNLQLHPQAAMAMAGYFMQAEGQGQAQEKIQRMQAVTTALAARATEGDPLLDYIFEEVGCYLVDVLTHLGLDLAEGCEAQVIAGAISAWVDRNPENWEEYRNGRSPEHLTEMKKQMLETAAGGDAAN